MHQLFWPIEQETSSNRLSQTQYSFNAIQNGGRQLNKSRESPPNKKWTFTLLSLGTPSIGKLRVEWGPAEMSSFGWNSILGLSHWIVLRPLTVTSIPLSRDSRWSTQLKRLRNWMLRSCLEGWPSGIVIFRPWRSKLDLTPSMSPLISLRPTISWNGEEREATCSLPPMFWEVRPLVSHSISIKILFI